jgi:NAD(P)-dependent dehydrogenase (short-subunit alcohol dehydrogenase family)
MDFQDRVVLITGAAGGIGRGCAARFARDGACVVVADVDRDKGAEAARAIGEETGAPERVRFVHCDVADRVSVDAAVEDAVATWGRLDVCVANAAIVHGADFLEIEEADFDRVLDINLKGVFRTGQAAARAMARLGTGGSIVNMSSINAQVALPNQVPYCVAKGGIQQLTKVMALSLADHGIRVNAVGPGSIGTEMLASVLASDPQAREKVLSRTPLHRLGTVEEIAGVTAFLASDDAGYITGQTLYADGGRLALNYTVSVPEGE